MKPRRKMTMKGKLITCDEATPALTQHESPCSDCPFRRDSIPGWLGGHSPEEFVSMAHGESDYPCHVLSGAQCAGMAVYRANVGKRPRSKRILQLARNVIAVFARPKEFLTHHNRKRVR
jgi:hypothetical protein